MWKTIHDTGLKTGNKMTQQRILRNGQKKVRLLLNVDGYPDQSYVRAEGWMVGSGWTTIVHLNGHETELPARYGKTASAEPAFQKVMKIAEEVLA